jgi:negative regulator of flagellin synthesis FlgM
MRISGEQNDISTRVNSVSGTSSPKTIGQNDESTSGASETSAATAVFSTRAQEIIRAKQAAENAPEVREDLVQSLKDKIDSGQYQVSSEDIAEKMLSHS